jgi:regulator of protease activity HflC (stomatin/prohibitin superfamily)
MSIYQFLQFASLIAWAIFLVLVVGLFGWRAYKRGFVFAFQRLFSWVTVVAVIPVLVVNLFSLSIIFVPPTHIGVIISFLEPRGYRDNVIASGRYLVLPLVEQVVIYPVYQQTYTMSAAQDDAIAARTRDEQVVFVDTSVIYALDADDVIQVHINWQDRYRDEFVRPTIRNAILQELANYNASEINSQTRQIIAERLNESLPDVFAAQGITFAQVLIRNIGLSPEYAAAIEQKQVRFEEQTQSEFQAEIIRELADGQADRITQLAQARAARTLAQAQAEADALALVSLILNDNPELLTDLYSRKIGENITFYGEPIEDPFSVPTIFIPYTSTPTATVTPSPTATATATAPPTFPPPPPAP